MRKFNYEQLADMKWDNEIVSYVSKIHEYKGRQDLYIHQKPVELERLVEVAKRQSTESSNEIEGIVTARSRLNALMSEKTTPKNRDEKEIIGYRDVLNLIHESYLYMPIKSSMILQMHRNLLKYTTFSYGGKFKNVSNEIDEIASDGTRTILFKPLEPFETPEAMDAICKSYQNVIRQELVDPLILIPCFILDFLCIHPFNDGNGRMSRLLTLLLLYQNGFMVGKYISIEKAIADTKSVYYQSLSLSNQEWHTEQNDPLPFVKYMLQIILYCYSEFEERINRAEGKKTSYEVVKEYAENKLGKFTKQDVIESCPSMKRASAEAALKKLVDEGILERHGRSRNIYYALSNYKD